MIVYIKLFIVLLFFSCTNIEKPNDFQEKDISDQESWNPVIILTWDGIKRSVIKSSRMYKSEKKNEIILELGIDADLFSKDEKHMSNLKSDRAIIFEKTDNLLATGNVRVFSDSGVTLFTDSLLWNNKNEKIFSNDSVMLTTNYNDTLYGIGFESNVDLTHWKIKKPWGVSSEN